MIELLRFAETQQHHADALAKATGEHFNVFQILRVGHLEVTTHSPILAELLKPNGVHGQGAAFLRLFLAHFKISGFDADTAKVKMEHSIGAVTDDSGGRIDILIKDGKGATILIENKIYAGDQPNQMTRYAEFYPTAHLFYLTLDRREPEGADTVQGIHCISYANDVLAWLKDCRKEAACVHTVRETISQYIHLLQDLTHQNTSTRMNQELTNAVLQNQDSYKAFMALCHARREIRAAILAGLNDNLRKIAETLNLELAQPISGDGRSYDGWLMTGPALAAQNLRIGFYCASKDYQNFFFGFTRIDIKGIDSPVTQVVQELFKAEFGMLPPTESCAAHSWWNDHRYWTDATFESIRFGSFTDELRTMLERLLKVFQLACAAHQSTATI
jgi:hypothetical protein